MTAEHLAAMREGRRRKAEQDRTAKAARMEAWRAWSKRDARRWAALREAQDRKDDVEVARLRAASKADPMPVV